MRIGGIAGVVCLAMLVVGCGGRGGVSAATRARANTECRRENAVISNDEERLAGNFTAADFDAIQNEVVTLQKLGLDSKLASAFSEIDQAKTTLLSGDGSPAEADAHLLAAQKHAAKLGITCSFGALPMRLFR